MRGYTPARSDDSTEHAVVVTDLSDAMTSPSEPGARNEPIDHEFGIPIA